MIKQIRLDANYELLSSCEECSAHEDKDAPLPLFGV